MSQDHERLAAYYVMLSGYRFHKSDCSTSIAPAEMPGPCDCGGVRFRPYNSSIPIEESDIKTVSRHPAANKSDTNSRWIVDLYDGDSVICVEC